MNFLFDECYKLKSLPELSKWDISRVIFLNNFFSNCRELTSIPDISKWNTKNVENMKRMFYYCESLKSFSQTYQNGIPIMLLILRECFLNVIH